jgi:ribosome-associated heat shock protein Hsp15
LKSNVRIDKWLYAVRLYKSRTQATEACEGGKVKINGHSAKPSRHLEENEIIAIKKGDFTVTLKVLKLIEKRVGAPVAQSCYEDITPHDENIKKPEQSAFYLFETREKGEGRPTKKNMRDINKLKEEWWENWVDE